MVMFGSDKNPGLGGYLYESLNDKTPIIGVAKRSFHAENNKMKKIFRGQSTNPLYITSEGIELEKSADLILNMQGDFRIPSLLKKVDQLCRNW